MIASVPQLLQNFYDNHLKPKYHASRAEMKNIRTAISAIAVLRQKSNMSQTDGQIIRNHMNTIADNIVLLGGGAIPESDATFSTKTVAKSKLGKNMTATTLSMRGPKKFSGSSPFETTPVWDEVNRRPSMYVCGHLLNHNLYGPGKNENMTPLTIDLNNEMARDIEKPLKEAVFEDGKAIRYTVTVTYGNHANRDYSDRDNNWIPEELYLATQLAFEAHELDPANKWADKPGGKINIPAKKPHVLPPDTVPKRLPAININTASEVAMVAARMKGIGAKRAHLLMNLRRQHKTAGHKRFNSYDDLLAVPGITQAIVDELRAAGRITLY